MIHWAWIALLALAPQFVSEQERGLAVARAEPADGSAWLGGECKYRQRRGGSWYYAPRNVRAASRAKSNGLREAVNGFRLARTLP
jgi:formylglycine-generating enzyme required for sulfatase activity